MSRVDLDLLLLTQRYSSFQIQRYLQFFGLLGPYLPDPSIQFLNYQCPFQFHLSNTRNLIIQQNSRIISDFHHFRNENIENSQEKEEKANSSTHQDQTPNSNLLKVQNFYEEQDDFEELTKTKKNKKKKKVKKINLKQKRQKQLKRNQSQNSKRNIIPNQIHQMLSILFKKKRSISMVEDLLKKYSPSQSQFSSHRFYLYQSLLKQKINHYINQEGLKILFTHFQPSYLIYSRQQQIIYNKIALILIDHFLKTEATLIILNSQRIKSQNKLDHLKAKRYLRDLLTGMIKQQGY